MTLTRPAPTPPGDDPLLWGFAAFVAAAMLLALATGCENVETNIDVAVHLPCDVCEDLNPCTADRCTLEGCVHDPIYNMPCEAPGLPSGVCWDGACTCIDAAGCDDGDPCTFDVCNAGACGHEAAPNGSACSTDDVLGGACFAGKCVCTADEQCDDGDPETNDDCIISACHHN